MVAPTRPSSAASLATPRLPDVIEHHRRELTELCRRRGIVRLCLFGSAIRPDFDDRDSDFDFVADYADGHPDSLLDYAEAIDELADLLGRRVDLVNRAVVKRRSLIEEMDHTEITIVGQPRHVTPYLPDRYPMTDDERAKQRLIGALEDVEQSCDDIADFVKDLSLEAYVGNRMAKLAVERAFTIIGEAIVRIRHLSQDGKLKDDPTLGITGVQSIVAFRNLIVHEYEIVDDHVVLRIIKEDVPVLRDEVRKLLDNLA
jgi:uncharacterized protein with HEPN domain/predicted nucleotidyltransferase